MRGGKAAAAATPRGLLGFFFCLFFFARHEATSLPSLCEGKVRDGGGCKGELGNGPHPQEPAFKALRLPFERDHY